MSEIGSKPGQREERALIDQLVGLEATLGCAAARTMPIRGHGFGVARHIGSAAFRAAMGRVVTVPATSAQ